MFLVTFLIFFKLLDISCDPIWIPCDPMWGRDPQVEKHRFIVPGDVFINLTIQPHSGLLYFRRHYKIPVTFQSTRTACTMWSTSASGSCCESWRPSSTNTRAWTRWTSSVQLEQSLPRSKVRREDQLFLTELLSRITNSVPSLVCFLFLLLRSPPLLSPLSVLKVLLLFPHRCFHKSTAALKASLKCPAYIMMPFKPSTQSGFWQRGDTVFLRFFSQSRWEDTEEFSSPSYCWRLWSDRRVNS